jgi:transglutaminase-like putative cysteine protease
MLRKSVLILPLLLMFFATLASAQAVRHFTFHYSFTVRNIPAGQRVRVWIPLAHSDPYQDVKVISAKGNLPLKKTRESKYENESYYAVTSKAKQSELHFEVVYNVVRRERLTLGVERPRLEEAELSNKERAEFLAPDRLVPVSGLPAELAAEVVAGKQTTLEKARAIYDYVFANMRYDKSGSGWGRGDVLWACNSKYGNCTDFHSLFISMARSQEIPARFSIGFPIPPDKHSGEIPGYHCWADFFDPEHGWVAVDISEAWLDPSKKNYYFGAQDQNRVQFTMGRDLELNPRQDGPPLNYFVYPYVEVAGKPYPNISNEFSFADVDANVAAAH